MRILVYEYSSGGGYAHQPIPLNVLSEGFAMLRSVVADFKAAGHEVTVLLDDRISKLNPPIDADYTVPVFQAGEAQRFLHETAKVNEAILVIAPETGQTLQSLVEIVEKSGVVSLNCESSGIAKVADKAGLYEALENAGFQVPKTVILNSKDTTEQSKAAIEAELQYPVVIKPVDGTSCAGLSIVNDSSQIEAAVAKAKEQSPNKPFLAQGYIEGESVSVSLLTTGKKILALSLNKQNLTIAAPNETSSYDGGYVPFDHPLKQEALITAKEVIESLRGLRGYVGVDLILAEDAIFVVDVNPRLTTSYVGLRRVAGFNVAEAIVTAVLNGKLPRAEPTGVACFSKVETATPTLESFQKAAAMENVVSPPFPIADNTEAYALLLGYADTKENALKGLEEAKKSLHDIIN